MIGFEEDTNFEGDTNKVSKVCCCTVTQTVVAITHETPEGGSWTLEIYDTTGCKPCPPPEELDVWGNPKQHRTMTSARDDAGGTMHNYFSLFKRLCGDCKCYTGAGNPPECFKGVSETGSWTGKISTVNSPKWVVEMTCDIPCPELTGIMTGSKSLRVSNALGVTLGPNCLAIGDCCKPSRPAFGVNIQQ